MVPVPFQLGKYECRRQRAGVERGLSRAGVGCNSTFDGVLPLENLYCRWPETAF